MKIVSIKKRIWPLSQVLTVQPNGTSSDSDYSYESAKVPFDGLIAKWRHCFVANRAKYSYTINAPRNSDFSVDQDVSLQQLVDLYPSNFDKFAGVTIYSDLKENVGP